MRPLPLEVIHEIASYIPPSSTFIHLLRLSRAVYRDLLPLLWSRLEIDHHQLQTLLRAYHVDSTRAISTPGTDLLPYEEISRNAAGATLSGALEAPRQPLRYPWSLVQEITLWSAPAPETVKMITSLLDDDPPTRLFPSLQTLRIPLRLIHQLARAAIVQAHPRHRNGTHSTCATFIRLFRPSSLVILRSSFAGQSPPRESSLDRRGLIRWMSNLVQDWTCVKEVRWEAFMPRDLCLVVGIRNVVVLAPEEYGRGQYRGDWRREAVENVLDWTRMWEDLGEQSGDTKIVWDGPHTFPELLEAQKQAGGALTVEESMKAIAEAEEQGVVHLDSHRRPAVLQN